MEWTMVMSGQGLLQVCPWGFHGRTLLNLESAMGQHWNIHFPTSAVNWMKTGEKLMRVSVMQYGAFPANAVKLPRSAKPKGARRGAIVMRGKKGLEKMRRVRDGERFVLCHSEACVFLHFQPPCGIHCLNPFSLTLEAVPSCALHDPLRSCPQRCKVCTCHS